MSFKKIIFFLLFSFTGLFLSAQETDGLQEEMTNMIKEKDPVKLIAIMNDIVKHHQLDSLKDAETIDVLTGNVAVAFAMHKNYDQFEHYIGLIKNKFNQTSFRDLAVGMMLKADIDAESAQAIAQKTIALYQSYRYDKSAKPANYTNEDWERFMNFAQYVYNDTYAKALFFVKKYDEALRYQKMSFNRNVEDGVPDAVERYARLLELNGHMDSAKLLLIKLAKRGKLNRGMSDQLKTIFIAENGAGEKFSFYLDSLQSNVKVETARALSMKMLNQVAPSFSLNDIKGHRVKLSDYRGKIVVLDLWATWCAPCIASLPTMNMLTQKYPDVVFLFIAVEENPVGALERIKKFIRQKNYGFNVLMDEPVKTNASEYKISSTYKPSGIPAKYVIDKNGYLRFESLGFSSEAQLVNELEAMIAIVTGL